MSKPSLNKLNTIYSLFFDDNESRNFNKYQIFSKFSTKFIPSWFRPMLEDMPRNLYYQEMIKGNVKDKVVIDLGSGTGMWTMEALSQGAKFVYLVERNPVLIKYLEKIFLNFPVKIIGKDISDLTNEDFNQCQPEVVIHEIFSTIAISEGVIPAFKKVNSLFNNISYIPQYFWMDASIAYVSPIKVSEKEKSYLGTNEELYYEILYPSRIRSRALADRAAIESAERHELNFVDLSKIDNNYQVKLNDFPIVLKNGKVHQVHLGFRFSAKIDDECFDTTTTESHWGGIVAEFYVSKYNEDKSKQFEFKLNDINIDTFIIK